MGGLTAAPGPDGDPELVCLGETMALVSAARGGLLRHQRELVLGIGGSESNVAIGARRLGASSAWVGRVGDDEFGALVQRELRAEAVQVRAAVDPVRPTGLMVKERRGEDVSRVWYYRSGSAGAHLSPADLDRGLIERARLLHVSGISLALSGTTAETVRLAVEWARAVGVPVSLDVNYRARLWTADRFAAAVGELLPLTDVLFGSAHEYAHLVDGDDDRAVLARLAGRGPAEVVLKRGAQGACALAQGEFVESAAVRVPVVDTVGAGDAFVAGWLAERLRGTDAGGRMRTAVLCGALACTVEGDWEGAPTRDELLRRRSGADPVER